ncbi:Transposase DDE domain protein [Gimesia panareensis]|uniref:Transposase DDE domain protein n=1 Tax=Gimesia panareensis TaxID=2527978 RepID=A0A518FT02_9PLAN|nr:IS4 family transposase [Gimesia panareensis]QDV16449.1 Transposase DDE domain protein [Gimesia panareensis]QDV18749.1 Transposase DDE domain protein [Gimesia panareensis]QDV19216.1 Transposase DDE domain protein [Gimesia panareensis]QDV19440.1 Transposase DDE domain protein [Gimesia panareensis]QDV21109.1 Transposase DDE domain protein [Gimesia panareensis]
MAKKQTDSIQACDITGLKYLDRVLPLFKRLRPEGTERDKAGNRQLFYDQYCALQLLYLFNPIVTSLRGLQQASELKKVQRKLGCPRSSLGSLSEAVRVFDPELLQEIVGELIEKLPAQEPQDRRLQDLAQTLTAVDGTFLKTLPQITQACFSTRQDKGWQLHTHFEILRGIPVRMDLTDATGRKDGNEKSMLTNVLEKDRCYILDRAYEKYALFNAIVNAGSSYVCRIRGDHIFVEQESRELTAEARAAGVLEDQVGQLGSPKSRRIEHPDHPVRRITVKVTPHPKRGGRRREGASQDLVVATSLLDVPAEIIALIYQHRWQIELFFRFLKHVLGCRHLLSQNPQGIQIQTYCAMIACLLISLITGKKPTLRTFEMLCFYFSGLADEDDLINHINRLQSHESR